jgi:hypothetical protein
MLSAVIKPLDGLPRVQTLFVDILSHPAAFPRPVSIVATSSKYGGHFLMAIGKSILYNESNEPSIQSRK